MSKVTLQQAKRLVDQLPLSEKMRLLSSLEKEAAEARWSDLLSGIDRRRRGRRFTMREIQQEIDAVRQARRSRSH